MDLSEKLVVFISVLISFYSKDESYTLSLYLHEKEQERDRDQNTADQGWGGVGGAILRPVFQPFLPDCYLKHLF